MELVESSFENLYSNENIKLLERSNFLMKNSLITSGVYQLFLDTKKQFYLNDLEYNNENQYLEVIPDIEVVKECFKIYRANRQRKYNNWNEICKWYFALEKINLYKKYKLVFGTLTFNDKTLKNTSERTRTRYVTKFLSDNTFHYIANIDFGEKNNREHYHFIAMIEKNIDMSKWSYGGNKILNIPLKKRDVKSVKNYLLKLNNHSYKESTKQKRIIRDRKEDKILDYFIEEIASESFHKFKLLLNSYE